MDTEELRRGLRGVVRAGTVSSIYPERMTARVTFADNDKNRVVIITAQGTEKTKEKVVIKKFRTKEVRERVN